VQQAMTLLRQSGDEQQQNLKQTPGRSNKEKKLQRSNNHLALSNSRQCLEQQ